MISLKKVYQPAITFQLLGGIAIDARSKKPIKHFLYDDETIENMVRYYKVEDNFDSLLRYIKSNNPHQEDEL